jgi:hypothetical protein
MLRRSLAITALLVMLAVALTACNLPGSPGLSILNRISMRPTGAPKVALAAARTTTPHSDPITQTTGVTDTQMTAFTATQSAPATATPLNISGDPIPTLVAEPVVTGGLESLAGTPGPLFDSPVPTGEPTTPPEVIPSVIIEFPTPDETETVAPTEPTATAPVSLTMDATAPISSTPTMELPTTPPPAPALVPTTGVPSAAPTQQMAPTARPEIVWIDDLPGFRQSKVMGWAAGQSYPIAVAGKSNTTIRIASFNVSAGGAWLAYTLTNSPYIFQAEIGGQQRKIAPPRLGWRFRLPKWSPTVDRLAFIAEFQPAPGALPVNVGLWTCAPDGSDLRQVVRGDGGLNQGVTFADWHPDGKQLVYAFDGPSGAALPQWLSVPAGGGAPSFLPLSGTLYDISADGSWLLGDGYTPTAPQNRREFSYSVLMRIPVDGKIGPSILTPACRSDAEGRISPDGSRVLALSWPSVSPACPRISGPLKYELWVMNSDGSGRLALDAKNDIGREFPQWSADGQAVYYSVLGSKGPEIWRADVGGAIPPAALPETTGADRFRVVH